MREIKLEDIARPEPSGQPQAAPGAPPRQRSYREEDKSRHRHTASRVIMAAVILAVLGVLGGAYYGVSRYYVTRFFPGTLINGMDASGMTVKEAENRIANEAESYALTVKERGGVTETLDAAHIGYSYVSDGSVQDIKNAQNPMKWMYAYFHPENYTSNVATAYDPETLRSALKALSCFDEARVTEPSDARIEQTDGGTYRLVSEVEGNKLDEEKVYELVKAAVDAGETEVDLEAAGCYLAPAVRADDADLQARYAVLSRYQDMTVTYLIGDEKKVLDSATILSWMTVGEDYSVSFDWNMAADWLAALGDAYNTIGTMQPFVTALGESITVQAVTYGWKIDEANEINELLTILETGESAEREPLYLETANTRGKNDIGSTYIEIDYTNQRMWFYKDGVLLVDTYVVTGNSSKGMDSPTGIYCIYNREQNATLKGEDYETPVNYWMPFYGGVGIHDATWRSSFGGEIYKTGGSHGCINTPLENAAIIYENVSIGTPVICYYGSIDDGDGWAGVTASYAARGYAGALY